MCFDNHSVHAWRNTCFYVTLREKIALRSTDAHYNEIAQWHTINLRGVVQPLFLAQKGNGAHREHWTIIIPIKHPYSSPANWSYRWPRSRSCPLWAIKIDAICAWHPCCPPWKCSCYRCRSWSSFGKPITPGTLRSTFHKGLISWGTGKWG